MPLDLALTLTLCLYACVIHCESVSRSFVSNSVIPWTVAHQAPLSMEFSRQEYYKRPALTQSFVSSYVKIHCTDFHDCPVVRTLCFP